MAALNGGGNELEKCVGIPKKKCVGSKVFFFFKEQGIWRNYLHICMCILVVKKKIIIGIIYRVNYAIFPLKMFEFNSYFLLC